jgi:hypothetical protein
MPMCQYDDMPIFDREYSVITLKTRSKQLEANSLIIAELAYGYISTFYYVTFTYCG